MFPRAFRLLFSVALFVLINAAATLTLAQISVTTWHYDNLRSGANTSETTLTPQNVNSTSFGKLFSQTADGAIIGQPLYLPGVKVVNKGKHNVAYVATMNDSVYAFDADNATGNNAKPLWQTTLLPTGAAPVTIAQQGCGGTTGWSEVGVVSTPVIDPVAGTLFVVAKTYENSSYVHRLHALDVKSGKEKTGSPVVLTGTFMLGTKKYTFQDYMQVNRPALLLQDGTVYIAFGSNGCRSGLEQGWVMAYNSTTLQTEGAFDVSPGKSAAAIWQRGGGLSADSDGYVYGTTADGAYVAGTAFGESVLKLGQSGTSLQLSDWFTPYNEADINKHDLDLNEPVLILPDQTGLYPHLAATVGKQGTVYILNRDSMGHFCGTTCTSDTQIPQELTDFAVWSGALVYWNGFIYTSPNGGPISALAINNGIVSTTPSAQSKKLPGGSSPIITSNGTANGVLWQLDGNAAGVLAAFDATTLAELYSTGQAGNNRDTLPPVPHFANFMVANGKLYVGTNTSLFVYGLLP